ncbi:MAG: undecaprenyl-phosphate glucose phosphotransferase [Kiloniellales bacterium]
MANSSTQTLDVGLRPVGPRPLSLTMVTGLLRLYDVSAIIVLGLACDLVYHLVHGYDFSERYLAPIFLGTLIGAGAFHFAGLYQEKSVLEGTRRFQRLLGAWTLTVVILIVLTFISKTSAEYSRVWTVSWWMSTVIALWFGGVVIAPRISRLAAQGRFARHAVIVGAGQHGERLAKHLQQFGAPYLNVLGFFDDRKDRVPAKVAGYDVLGDTSALLKFTESHRVDVVIIALPWSAEQRLLTLIKQLAVKPIQLRLAPDLIGFNFLDRSTTTDARLPMLHLFDRPISGWSYAAKTVEDWVIALAILLFLGPLMLIIAVAIKLDSPGPVLFRQKRYGFNDQPIEVFKFRSMYHNAGSQDGSRQASKDDPRITRLGRFLRKSSLDELPQVLNVLKGDMSIVGPRPHPLALRSEGRHFEEVVDRYAARHRVKPGITGWAQVCGWRGETDTLEKIQHRVEHDLYYIDNWSVGFDLRIILKTLRVVWDDQNAY